VGHLQLSRCDPKGSPTKWPTNLIGPRCPDLRFTPKGRDSRVRVIYGYDRLVGKVALIALTFSFEPFVS
jgi:hypothetical protein